MKVSSKLIFIFAFLFSMQLVAQSLDNKCADLGRFACAPGSYNDGTGVVKSETQVNDLIDSLQQKYKSFFNQKFTALISNSQSSSFRQAAISALGLNAMAACQSGLEKDQLDCNSNILEGLSTYAQKQNLGPLMRTTVYDRVGNLQDFSELLKNSDYQKVISEYNLLIQQDLRNPALENKVQNEIFPAIQRMMKDRISAMPINEPAKSAMIAKLQAVTFSGFDCRSMRGKSSREPDGAIYGLFIPNAQYFPEENKNFILYCNGRLLRSSSVFEIAKTLAHELAHSIDPCGITFKPTGWSLQYSTDQDLNKMESEYPVPGIIQCLRRSDSIGAKNLGSLMRMEQGQERSSVTFCNDQISESFADWMSAEILPKYIEETYKNPALTAEQYRVGYSNTIRSICNNEPQKELDTHPRIVDRLNKIFMVHPKIRSQIGCPVSLENNQTYCDVRNAGAVQSSSSSPKTSRSGK